MNALKNLVNGSHSLRGLPVNISYLIGNGSPAIFSVNKFLFLIDWSIPDPNSRV